IRIDQTGFAPQFFHFEDIPQLELNTTYKVRAKHMLRFTANGSIGEYWSDYGPYCTIGIAGPEITQLLPQYCNSVEPYGFDDYIQAYAVTFADQYRFTLDDGVSSIQATSTSYTLFLDNVPGLEFNSTYSVTVQSRVNGLWSDPGPACDVNMVTTVPPTALQAAYCNGNYDYPSAQYIFADYIGGADKYEWGFTPVGGGPAQYQLTNGYSLAFHWASSLNLQAGTSYSVAIRARLAGQWGSYGAECPINLNSPSMESSDGFAAKVDLDRPSPLILYPNPSSGEFRILAEITTEEIGSASVLVVDVMGREVYSENIPVKGSTLNNVIRLPESIRSGMYRIQVSLAETLHDTEILIDRTMR
ncbi:MAG: T9SS type A sorting domain-containing protein, partial [Flavobacteriales bacterium]|nr:T9SS type A sorting domain-containing protein [Flavobacteriales bacterium]